jgi:excisionase family DNA binding protein
MDRSANALVVPHHPSEEDVRVARSGRGKLRNASDRAPATLTLHENGMPTEVEVPEIALQMLRTIMEEIAEGHAVAVAAVDRTITTQEAADLLGVSRPYLIKVLERGDIPFQKVGTHRRVRLVDVLEYRARAEAAAEAAYAELVAQGQELRMGYD